MKKTHFAYRFPAMTAVFILVIGMFFQIPVKAEEGLKFLSTGEFEKAEAIYNEILKGDAENIQAGYYLGISLLMQEKYKEALGIFRNLEDNLDNKAVMGATEIPTKGQVEIGLVRSYLGLKNYPEAVKHLATAEKAGTDPADLHTYRGVCYLETNKNAEAKEELEKAIELNSQNPHTYYYGGIANIRMGNPQRATELFKMFLQMAPYAPEAEHAKFLVDTLC